MNDLGIGVHITGGEGPALVEQIVAAERAGLDCAWLTSQAASPDPMAVLAAAGQQTERIRLGTAIVHTFPRPSARTGPGRDDSRPVRAEPSAPGRRPQWA